MRPVSHEWKRFRLHRRNAKLRGIPFLLTFDEWWKLWQDSGHWDQRGWRKGQYCMSRPGDKGAYEIGNVQICLNEENRAERNRNYPLAGELNPAYGRNYWLRHTPERLKTIGAAISKTHKGKPKSAAQRAAMAAAATGRRRVIRDGHLAWAHSGDPDYPNGGI